ncbi:MAG: hypothetical protein AAFQ37_07995 [Bacteroidota bacterium]
MKYLVTLLICMVFTGLFAQQEELLEELSTTTCECIKETDSTVGFEMTIGLCMLQAAGPKSDEIKEHLGIDLSDLDNYEALGEAVAPALMTNCPEFMTLMMEAAADGDLDLSDDEEEDLGWDELLDDEEVEEWSDIDGAQDDDLPEYGGPDYKEFITSDIPDTNGSSLPKPTIEGGIQAINEGLVNEVVVKDREGKLQYLYLTNEVSGWEKLKAGAKVKLTYISKDWFHAGKGQREQVWFITSVE